MLDFVSFLKNRDKISQDVFLMLQDAQVGIDIEDILLEVAQLSEDELYRLKAEYYNFDYITLDNLRKLENIDYSKLEKLKGIPVSKDEHWLDVAIYDPQDLINQDRLRHYFTAGQEFQNHELRLHIAKKSEIQNKFNEILYSDMTLSQQILIAALNRNASDAHITPYKHYVKVMFRIDGELMQYRAWPIGEYSALAVSLKVMAKLDISESRRPQSGQFEQGNVDFRLSTHPTIFGENIVIRILRKDREKINIYSLGYAAADVEYLKNMAAKDQGMIIFCGPTGAGKSTSIYALIETMDKTGRNIMTLEDPVEYHIANVRQTEIKRGILDFAQGIRSILRQDPDVVLIGEIRDEETAKMAIRAAMTGHLVLTTLHATNPRGAMSRLLEFGIAQHFVDENVKVIVSQRLVRNKPGTGRVVQYEILDLS